MTNTKHKEAIKDILQMLASLLADMEQEDYEQENYIKLVPRSERILSFPAAEQNNQENENKVKSAFLQFTDKEIKKMPKQFRPIFKIGKTRAHIRKTKSGSYQIRVMINGQSISAQSKNLQDAKQLFIERLYNPEKWARERRKNKDKTLLGNYMLKWLEVAKKPYIKENTFNEYVKSIKLDILPKFGDKALRNISSFDIQEHINQYTEQGKNRTAKKIYQLLNAVFEYAVADGIIDRSPTKKVTIGSYEQEHGTALTRSEEKQIIDDLNAMPTSRYRQAFVFIMYTGLRRSELASVQLEGEWITVVTAKQRKGKKEKIRRIPISPMLSKMLPSIEIELIKQTNPNKLTCEFSDLYPKHHLHELRHTFITRCQECGIAREIVSVWAGHSTDKSITSTVYTHLEQYEERQIEEIKKFNYNL